MCPSLIDRMQAYIMGRFDDTFKNVISSVSAMVFLGTPHRGSNLAKLLNKLLAASTIGPSPKQYVADLAEDSPAIEDLNDQFRNVPTEIGLTSFYETRYSTAGYKKLVRLFSNLRQVFQVLTYARSWKESLPSLDVAVKS